MGDDEPVPVDVVMASLRGQVGEYAGRVALLEAKVAKRDAEIAELRRALAAAGASD